MNRCNCGEFISDKRYDVGYRTCLRCGDRKAQSEIKEKMANVAPLFNKGPLGFLGTTTSRSKEAGNSNQRSVVFESDSPIVAVHIVSTTRPTKEVKPKRKPIGILYTYDEPNGILFYETNDPRLKNAIRHAYFAKV